MPTPAALNGLPGRPGGGLPRLLPRRQVRLVHRRHRSTTNVDGPLEIAPYNAANQRSGGGGRLRRRVTTLVTPRREPAGRLPGLPPRRQRPPLRERGARRTARQTDSVMVTRDGARSELWWVNAGGGTPKPRRAGQPQRKGYLPSGRTTTAAARRSDPRSAYSEIGLDDTTLNYEPTVLPVVGGGLRVGRLHEPPHVRQRAAVDALAELAAGLRHHQPRQRDGEEALGRGDRSQRPAGHGPEPPGLLPARAGAPRRQLARLLGARPVQGRTARPASPATSAATATASPTADGGRARLLHDAADVLGVSDKCTTAADCCDSTNKCINGYCAQQGAQ